MCHILALKMILTYDFESCSIWSYFFSHNKDSRFFKQWCLKLPLYLLLKLLFCYLLVIFLFRQIDHKLNIQKVQINVFALFVSQARSAGSFHLPNAEGRLPNTIDKRFGSNLQFAGKYSVGTCRSSVWLNVHVHKSVVQCCKCST